MESHQKNPENSSQPLFNYFPCHLLVGFFTVLESKKMDYTLSYWTSLQQTKLIQVII